MGVRMGAGIFPIVLCTFTESGDFSDSFGNPYDFGYFSDSKRYPHTQTLTCPGIG